MTETRHFDALILGSGQAGGPLATDLARAGHRTALIERVHVGGTCINEGCTPTKTMIASGRVAYLAGRGADYGVRIGQESIDMQKVRQRKRDIVTSFREGSTKRITATPGVELIMGEACFTGPHEIDVTLEDGGKIHLSAGKLFINTGARPSMPPLDGLDGVPALDSTTVMELEDVPDHLLVLGGGYVGLEFGQLFRRLGSRVTIIQQAPQLLGREDPDIAEAVAKILREDGIEIFLNSQAQRARMANGGAIELAVKTPDGERSFSGSHLLVAAGRRPNTDGLGAEAAGLELDRRGFVKVNERLETNVPGIWALGDVNGGPAFTHISYDDFRIVRDNLLNGGSRTTADRQVPYAVFIDPQLGRIGLSETEARQAGKNIRVAKMPMNHIARAIEVDEPRGLMKAIVDAGTQQILGAAVLGIEGGELMAMLQIAMLGKLPYTTLQHGIFAHPTLAEGFNTLFESWV